jgi:hypothetical protein
MKMRELSLLSKVEISKMFREGFFWLSVVTPSKLERFAFKIEYYEIIILF